MKPASTGTNYVRSNKTVSNLINIQSVGFEQTRTKFIEIFII